MSDYLKRRFPLDDTSTVYMSGKAVYNLVRRDRPGIIAPVELFPADAEEFRKAVRDAMAAAWDEAFDVGTAHGIAYQAGNDEAWKRPPNPYRQSI